MTDSISHEPEGVHGSEGAWVMTHQQDPRFDLLSIGHSNHRIDEFVDILRRFDIDAVADVRSVPWSRFNEQFNKRNVDEVLRESGIAYVFLGDELGGRPRDPNLYDGFGHALYGRMAQTETFREGLERLRRGAKDYRLVMMCSEENPAYCHRFLLITRVLRGLGVQVGHISVDRRSGPPESLRAHILQTEEIESFEDWADTDYVEESLFGGPMRSPWRSTRPVSQRNQQDSSSQH